MSLRRAISQAITRAVDRYSEVTGEKPGVAEVEDAISWGAIDALAAKSKDGIVREISVPKARSWRGSGSSRKRVR